MARTTEVDAFRAQLDKLIRVMQDEHDSRENTLTQLKAARAALDDGPTRTSTTNGKPRRAPARGKRRARNVAAKAEAVLRERGRATAAEITKALEVNSGSVSYALRVLEDKGVVRQTGRMVGRTREYELVGTGTVSEPGT